MADAEKPWRNGLGFLNTHGEDQSGTVVRTPFVIIHQAECLLT